MRRRLLAYLCLIIALVLASLAVFVFRPGDQINPESLAKIKMGMTEKDVEEILNGPGRFYTDGTWDGADWRAKVWDGADWRAMVIFNHEGLVLWPVMEPQETFAAKVRRWLGLQTRLPALDLWDANKP